MRDTKQKPAREALKLPNGYSINAAGLHYTDSSSPDKDPVTYRLGPPLEIAGRTRGATSEDWGLLLRWHDFDMVPHQWAMPATALFSRDGAWASELARCGWIPEPGTRQKALLAAFFAKVNPPSRIRCVSQVGWDGECFVLPDVVYGQGPEPVVLQSKMATNPYTAKGSLEGWQETVARLAIGNSRLILATCLALSGPLLNRAGMGPGGVNIFGGSSIGKTTALHAALSVWGGPEAKGSWNATKNGLEGALELHNDAFYTLDEMSEASGKSMSEVVFMIGNGTGRARAHTDGSARAIRRWRCSVLSTGEICVDEKLRQEGVSVRAGHGVRLIEIPGDAGAGLGSFEDLHGVECGRAFAEAIETATRENYGHAGRAFVQALIERGHELTLGEDLRAVTAEWTPRGASGQVGRVVRRFALLAVAGELATGFGVLPWEPGQAAWGIKRCLDAWLHARGGTGQAEDIHAIQKMTSYISRYGQSRIQSLDPDRRNERIFDCGGYSRTMNGKTQFIFLKEQLATILDGSNVAAAVQTFLRAGMLRQNENRLTQKIDLSIFGLGRKRCHVIELPEEDES